MSHLDKKKGTTATCEITVTAIRAHALALPEIKRLTVDMKRYESLTNADSSPNC